MKILWHGGVTRTVILTRRWAIKLPCLVYGWKYFLYGFLANMQEREWSGYDERLCPVRWAAPLGVLIIMPRCEPVIDSGLLDEEIHNWANCGTDKDLLPVELKSDSFGRLNGRLVAVDYGGCGRNGRTTKNTPPHAR